MATMTKRDQEVIDAYEAWDGNSADKSVDDLAGELNMSRQRLYQVLGKHNVPKKSSQGATFRSSKSGNDMFESVGRLVLDRLNEAERELAVYRQKYGPLD